VTGAAHRPGPGSRVVAGLPPVWVWTGSRTGWPAEALSELVARKLASAPDDIWHMHGGALGVDRVVQTMAAVSGHVEFRCPYLSKYGKRGGHLRNQAMATAARSLAIAGHSVEVFALWAGHGATCARPDPSQPGVGECHCGTLHMVDACAIFELPTKVIMPDGLVVTDMAELPWFVAPAARPLGGTHG
jgi:hypothetical protein